MTESTESAPATDAASLLTRLLDAFDQTVAEPGGFARIRDAMVEEDDFEAVAERVGGEMGAAQLDLIHPEIECDYAALGTQTVDSGPIFRGHAGWIQMWRAWLEPWESYEFGRRDIERIDDERALIDTLQIYRGRTSGAEVEIKQTGIWTARDGQLIRFVAFDTREEALAALESEPARSES